MVVRELKRRLDEIEFQIAQGRWTPMQVFTLMKNLIPQDKTNDPREEPLGEVFKRIKQ